MVRDEKKRTFFDKAYGCLKLYLGNVLKACSQSRVFDDTSADLRYRDGRMHKVSTR